MLNIIFHSRAAVIAERLKSFAGRKKELIDEITDRLIINLENSDSEDEDENSIQVPGNESENEQHPILCIYSICIAVKRDSEHSFLCLKGNRQLKNH